MLTKFLPCTLNNMLALGAVLVMTWYTGTGPYLPAKDFCAIFNDIKTIISL